MISSRSPVGIRLKEYKYDSSNLLSFPLSWSTDMGRWWMTLACVPTASFYLICASRQWVLDLMSLTALKAFLAWSTVLAIEWYCGRRNSCERIHYSWWVIKSIKATNLQEAQQEILKSITNIHRKHRHYFTPGDEGAEYYTSEFGALQPIIFFLVLDFVSN